MADQGDPDLSLYGGWTGTHDGAGNAAGLPERGADGPAPETKAAIPQNNDANGLRVLLGDMTEELRQQFALFRDLREGAQRLAQQQDADEAAQKLLRADAKNAADAVSLIVRTLDKIDSLQRQLARDRDEETERLAESRAYTGARAFFLARIEALALEKARAIVESRSGQP